MKKLLTIALISFTLISCATKAKYQAKLQVWQGQHFDNLVSSWGPPTSKTPLSNGAFVAEYHKHKVVQNGGYSYSVPQTTTQSGRINRGNGRTRTFTGTGTTFTERYVPVTSNHWWCKTRFTVSPSYIIQKTAVEGNDCKSK